MEKTTIYIDAELRHELQALAKSTGRPQAELIRAAVRQFVDRERQSTLPSWVGIAAVGGDAGVDKRRYREKWIRELERKYPRSGP